MEEAKSTHTAPVVKIKKEVHPNADSLSVVCGVLGNYTVCVRTDDWTNGELAIFCQPDLLVNTNLPEFDWLKPDAKYDENCEPSPTGTWARVKGKKLRGIMSYGLFVKPSFPVQEGDDVWEKLNIKRYEAPTTNSGIKGIINNGEVAAPPNIYTEKYDVDSGLRFAKDVFNDKELVVSTLKYHGQNWRCVYLNGEIHVGSRTEWKKEFPSKPTIDETKILSEVGEERLAEIKAKLDNWKPTQSHWWKAFRNHPEIEEFIKTNPGVVVYGELIGIQGKDFLYGLKPGEIAIKVFDLFKDGKYIDYKEARELGKSLPWVHVIHDEVPFDFNFFVNYAENMKCPLGFKIPEGFVVKPVKERNCDKIGRVQVKFISAAYTEKG